jgi:maltooligosyltrehalose trehalohydrolase
MFRVWAPDAKSMRVVIGGYPEVAMTKLPDGYFIAQVAGAKPGNSYSFYVDGDGPFPDPASRYQPEGVHGASAIVDPNHYQWHDAGWLGIALPDAVFYELHVGAFTPEGTYRSAAAKLAYLKDLGVTAVELMPLSDFAGNRNWGYDGVAPFAPARCYGTPDDLRSFVDQAHQLGLAVFLDVVYNHLGPDGAYQSCFSSHYFTKRHPTPWGEAVNFDGPFCQSVRAYVIENALRWIHEYHIDGLRLDATNTIKDDSPRHILAELTSAVSHSSAQLRRRVHVIAEDARNLASLVLPECCGGMGLAAVWADDFHHQMRRALAGDHDGYFAEFDGSIASIAKTIKRGWWRGDSDPAGIDYSQFVYCLQNHDQIGNRALGDRLPHAVDAATCRAASALLLLLPQTPLLFMGQEWAASTPFCYFTDHHAELGALVSAGRKQEFAAFSAFSHVQIPDPQALETFRASQLQWGELTVEPHASVLRLYKSLLRLRRSQLAGPLTSPELQIDALDDHTLLLRRSSLLAVIRLGGHGEVTLPGNADLAAPLWNSEDVQFAPHSQPIQVNVRASRILFLQPGAIVFRAAQKGGN